MMYYELLYERASEVLQGLYANGPVYTEAEYR